jgi:hypothetical protein
MAILKGTFFFVQRKWGWTETFYFEKDSHDQAMRAMQEIVPFRARMFGGSILSDGPHIVKLRVSDVDIQRDALVYTWPGTGAYGPDELEYADNPNLAIVARLSSGTKYWRQIYIRGQPDAVTSRNGIYLKNPIFERLVLEWVETLKLYQAGILAIDKVPPKPIIDVGVDGTNVLIKSAVPHELSNTSTVRILSVPGVKNLRGNFNVRTRGDTEFVLVGTVATNYNLAGYIGGGKYYKRTPVVKIIDKGETQETTHRITGGPFDRPHGRRLRRSRLGTL